MNGIAIRLVPNLSLGEDAYAAEIARGRTLELEDSLTHALEPTARVD